MHLHSQRIRTLFATEDKEKNMLPYQWKKKKLVELNKEKLIKKRRGRKAAASMSSMNQQQTDGIELPVGCDVQQNNEHNNQQSIAVKQLLQQNRNKETNLQQSIAVKSNSLCKTNGKSKGKLKKHDSVFLTFEQGSSSKNSSNYKCRRINKLNVSGDPPICDSCSNFLHETVDNLAGISMTVQPQPVETNVSNVIKNHPKVKMYIKMRTLMRLRGNYLHYWPQRFKDAFLLEVFVLKPTSTDCSSPSLIF
ncbi:uncharacterized protein LOC113770090 [Coffea eugenioides]|uniref:uncharacterized protein LOC113770090 n=1 Tax=Coffea eugenioides TaxID=49369 RepID=UPI000F614B91|nr:uncharacterized protein LOC113770090 [Coffea eugenioides]